MKKVLLILLILSVILLSCTSRITKQDSENLPTKEIEMEVITTPEEDLYNKAYQAYENKDWDKSIEYYLKLLELTPDNVDIIYNLASVYSLKNDKENSFLYLEKALKLAPEETKENAKTDPDFDNIKKEVRFKELIGE